MSDTLNRQASVDSRRIALEREITIRVPAFDSFVTEYSENISTTGMFIRTDSPQPPGTAFAFEFSVADDWKLIRGKGQVVWARHKDEGPERGAGMGIRFTELDAQSRRLIRWIVEKHIREGGTPFELDELRSAVDEALEEALTPEAEAPARPAAPSPAYSPRQAVQTDAFRVAQRKSTPLREKIMPLAAVAAVLLVLITLFFWFSNRSLQDSTAMTVAGTEGESEGQELVDLEPVDASAAAAEGGSDGGNEVAPKAAPDPAVVASALATRPRTLSEAVTDWAQAWSEQRVDDYLAHYSRSFSPGRGLSRSAWAAQRRERVSQPRFIRVGLSGLQVESVDADTARAVFTQTYRSNRMSDVVRKSLELRLEQGVWKIVRETSG